MQKTVADLATRWLTRKPEHLTDTESKVLQSASTAARYRAT